ncbi:MAG: 2-phosphosulfolactate phosphatase, partial [Thermoleophilia bacterium]|nr:2-phosphosulfolactate phosphatase [Thermoleophilia bacterium]
CIWGGGFHGAVAPDDPSGGGRGGGARAHDRSDAAEAAARLAASYPTALEVFRASRSGRNLINHGPELEADIPYCTRESVLDVVPRLTAMQGIAAEIRA